MRIRKGEPQVRQRTMIGFGGAQDVGILLRALCIARADDRRAFIADDGFIGPLSGSGCRCAESGRSSEQDSSVWRIHAALLVSANARPISWFLCHEDVPRRAK